VIADGAPVLAAAVPTGRAALMRRAGDWLVDYGVFVALAAVVAWFSIKIGGFFTWSTFSTIGLSASEIGILAAVFTVALIAGQVDLSVGALTGVLGSVLAVTVFKDGHPLWLGILLVVGVAVGVGLVHSVLSVDFGVNSVVLTFATAQVLFGFGQWFQTHSQNYAQGVSIDIPPRTSSFEIVRIVNDRWLGIPVPLLVMLVLYALLYVFLVHTRAGWHVYAIGANPDAARKAGIPVALVQRALLVATALSTVLAMFVFAGRVGSVQAGHGFGLEFDVMTAVLIGGASFAGGRGRVERTLAGVALVYVLRYGLQTLQVDPNLTKMIRGCVFIAAVALGALAYRRRAR
jgi:ribose transport system permease protein